MATIKSLEKEIEQLKETIEEIWEGTIKIIKELSAKHNALWEIVRDNYEEFCEYRKILHNSDVEELKKLKELEKITGKEV